ncbi:MAG: FtsX-like permease family protein [Planctomycetota bacterium]
MYQPLLTRRYLLSKVMPLLAALAVMLCTAMVLIVWSVMGGFLQTLLDSGRSLIGDVSIEWKVVGLPHYEELVEELEARDEIEAATPTIESLGLLTLDNNEPRFVTLLGIEPDGYDRVTGFYDRLWWRPLDEPLPRDAEGLDPRLDTEQRDRLQRAYEHGQTLQEPNPTGGGLSSAMVVGVEVTQTNRRTPEGYIEPRWGVFVPEERFTITAVPMSRQGVVIQPEYLSLPVANEFRSGMYDIDAGFVILPLEELQRILKMSRAERYSQWQPGATVINDDGEEVPALPEVIGIEPARVTSILMRAAPGFSNADAELAAEDVVEAYGKKYPFASPTRDPGWREWAVFQWEEKPGLRVYIAAVRKETALILVLFTFISLTAAFLVCAIFWSMVSEKTRDVGTLRAIGASRTGVAWLFLRYGMAIGIVGALTGGALAWTIVHNINPIHEWMGRALGLQIWDPGVYYFTEIPNQVDPVKATIVIGSGVLFSVLGALLPAMRAAWMDPVKALRFE